jgi:hypothetical protein
LASSLLQSRLRLDSLPDTCQILILPLLSFLGEPLLLLELSSKGVPAIAQCAAFDEISIDEQGDVPDVDDPVVAHRDEHPAFGVKEEGAGELLVSAEDHEELTSRGVPAADDPV